MADRPRDVDVIREMLERAGQVFETADASELKDVPEGSQPLFVWGNGHWIDGEWKNPPCPGGYSGFFTVLVFSADGDLLGVWGLE